MVNFNGSSSTALFMKMAQDDLKWIHDPKEYATGGIYNEHQTAKPSSLAEKQDSVHFENNDKNEKIEAAHIDDTNDGKFSALEAAKNFGGGILDTGKSIVTCIAEHPIMSTVGIAAGIAICANPIGAAVLAGAGLTAAAIKLVPAVFKAATAENGDEAEKEFRNIGSGTTEAALSLFAASSALKAVNGVKAASALGGAEAAAESTQVLSKANVISKAKTVASEVADTAKHMPKDFTKSFRLGIRLDFDMLAGVPKTLWRTSKACWQEKSLAPIKKMPEMYGKNIENGIKDVGNKIAEKKAAGKSVNFTDAEIEALQNYEISNPIETIRGLNIGNIKDFMKTQAPAILAKRAE